MFDSGLYSPFFQSGFMSPSTRRSSLPETSPSDGDSAFFHYQPLDHSFLYLDLAESTSLRSKPSLRRKPSNVTMSLQPIHIRTQPSTKSLRSIPSPKPAPESPPPARPLAQATNFPQRVRSVASTVATSYKQRARTNALAALEGRSRSNSGSTAGMKRNFMDLSEDEEEDVDEDSAEYYGSLVTSDIDRPGSALSSLDLGLSDVIGAPARVLSMLETEDVVIPPSPMGAQIPHTRGPAPFVPKLSIPSPRPKKTATAKDRVSFLGFSSSSSTTSSSSASTTRRTKARRTSTTPTAPPWSASTAMIPAWSPTSPFDTDGPWSAMDYTPSFLPPFTDEDIEVDFSTPPRPAPSPPLASASSPAPLATPPPHADLPLPLTSELILEQQSVSSSPPQRRTRTISTPTPSPPSKRKLRRPQAPLKSFIEFDLRSSSSSSGRPSSFSTSAFSGWIRESRNTSSSLVF